MWGDLGQRKKRADQTVTSEEACRCLSQHCSHPVLMGKQRHGGGELPKAMGWGGGLLALGSVPSGGRRLGRDREGMGG